MHKKVYIELVWRFHETFSHLTNFSPDGYEFLVAWGHQEEAAS